MRALELERLLDRLVEDYLSRNSAARIIQSKLEETGVGLRPIIDHITIRTLDIDHRAEEFLDLGYAYSETLNYEDWFAKIYRFSAYPALVVDQAYQDRRGEGSIRP